VFWAGPFSLSKLPLQMWVSGPHLIHGSLGQPKSTSHTWHFDRFSRYCWAHNRDRQTDRPTDHTTPSVAIGRIYVVLRCGLKGLRTCRVVRVSYGCVRPSCQGSEAGQRPVGSRRTHQADRLRHVQGGNDGGQDDTNVLRDTGLHRSRGTISPRGLSSPSGTTRRQLIVALALTSKRSVLDLKPWCRVKIKLL